MMKISKLMALTLALVLALSLFAACGGSNDNQSADQPAAPQEQDAADDGDNADEPGQEPVDADTPTLDRIRSAGKLVMLTNAAFPPFEYLGAGNEIAGVDADIAAEIAKEIGVELEIIDMDFDGIPMAISSGQGDLGVAGITANDERRQVVDFSLNYVETTQLIIVPEGSEIQTPDDIAGKTIGVQMGTTGDLFASDVEGAEVVRYKTGPDAGMALSNGQVDCVVIDAMPAEMIASANEGLVVLEEPFTEEEYAIAMAKGAEDLGEVVNRVLQRMLDDGTIDALIEQHMESLGE